MDLSKLSDSDLKALYSGNLAGMSEAGFAEFVKTQQQAKSPQQRAAEAMARDRAAADPTIGMSTGQRLAAGAGKAVADVGRSIMQATGNMSREDVDEIKRRDAPLMNTGAGRTGYVLGTGAVGVPVMMAPGANTVAGGALYGGLLGAMTPVGTDDSVVRNIMFGGGGGAAGAGAANIASRMLSPNTSQATRSMMRNDVPLTPGQAMGGMWKRIEDAATSIPVTGDIIRNAQGRSMEGFNAAVANRALSKIGNKLPANLAGYDAVNYVGKAIGDVYESALKRAGTLTADAAFDAELNSLTNMVKASTMPKEVQGQFLRVIQNQIKGKIQGQNAMTAQTWKAADSELGMLAAKYGGDASADKQLLGDALEEAQAIMRRWLQRATPADVSADVKAANAAWAEFKRMQKAATFLGARDGVFGPENYMNAVRTLDKSKDKAAFARGEALGQDFGSDALEVLGRTVPDSGTPFRTLVANPLGGLLSATATAPVAAAYASPRVMNAAQMLLAGQRPALATKAAAELQDMAPVLSALGITGANVYQRTGAR